VIKFKLVSLALLSLVLLLCACSDQANSSEGGSSGAIAQGRSRSDLQMEKLEIDLGTVFQRLSYNLEFPFVVSGPDSILISEIDTSCGCTKATVRADWDSAFDGESWPLERAIPAGAKGTVVAVFDGSLYTEEKASTITIRGNFLSNKITLGVTAFIEPIFTVSPSVVSFAQLQLTSLMQQEVGVDVRVTAMKSFEIVRWVKVTPGVRVEEIGKPETLEDERMVRNFRIFATADLPEGALHSALIAETSLGENLEIIVTGEALGPIRYVPQTLKLSFGVLDQGPSRTRPVKLESTGLVIPEPQFEVLGAAAAVMTPALEVKEAGKSYVIRVTLAEGAATGRYDGILRISFSSESGIPPKEIVLFALVR
jgi:hypothetical protein